MSSIILHGNLCRSREHMFGFMLKLRTFLWQTSLSRSLCRCELTLRTCYQHPIKLDSIFLFSFISRMGGWFEADSDGADKFISYLSIKVPGRFASFGRIPRNSSNLFLIEKWTQEMSWDIWQSKEMTRCCHHRSYSHKTFDNESDGIRMLIFSHEKVS